MTVLDTLALLGDTPSAIAQTLANKGIVGRVADVLTCPIAAFLLEQGYEGAMVGPLMVTCNEGYTYTPLPIADFIVRFDHGAYPELVAPE